MNINDTVRWNDKNDSPIVGIVVAIDGTEASVRTPYGQTLKIATDRLTIMQSSRLVETPSGVRWER